MKREQDGDCFHLILSVFFVLMMPVTAASAEWMFHHPEAAVAMSVTRGKPNSIRPYKPSRTVSSLRGSGPFFVVGILRY